MNITSIKKANVESFAIENNSLKTVAPKTKIRNIPTHKTDLYLLNGLHVLYSIESPTMPIIIVAIEDIMLCSILNISVVIYIASISITFANPAGNARKITFFIK